MGAAICETAVGTKSTVNEDIVFVSGETSCFSFGQLGEWSSPDSGWAGIASSEPWQSEQQSCESASPTTTVFAQRSNPASQRQTPVGNSSGRLATSVSNLAEKAVNNGSRLRIFH
jgi:hypothetical protein